MNFQMNELAVLGFTGQLDEGHRASELPLQEAESPKKGHCSTARSPTKSALEPRRCLWSL